MPSASQFGLAYVGALVSLVVLDGLWLGLIARNLYKREMGSLMRAKPRAAPAAAFYLLYPAAVAYLCLGSQSAGLAEAAARGAVLGLAAYGAYDMTNLAVVAGWPVRLTFIDLAWGTFATAVAASAGYEGGWLPWLH